MRNFMEETFTVIDLEVTGGRPESNGIMEIGMVKIQNRQLVDRFSSLVKPGFPIPPIVRRMTGIDESMLVDAPRFEALSKQITDFIGCDVIVVHNGPFDLQFLSWHVHETQRFFLKNPQLCTVKMGHILVPDAPNRRLHVLADHLGIPFPGKHRAWGDAEVTARVFLIYLDRLERIGVKTWKDLIQWQRTPPPKPLSKEENPPQRRIDNA